MINTSRSSQILGPICITLLTSFGAVKEAKSDSTKSSLPISRENCLKALKAGDEFDILIIGGGATGAGAGK